MAPRLATTLAVLLALFVGVQALSANIDLWIVLAFGITLFAVVKAFQYVSPNSEVTIKNDSFVLMQMASIVIISLGGALLGGRVLLGVS